MRCLNLFSILFTLILLLLVPNLAAASFTAEAGEIPYQINNSDRIIIGTVSRVDTHSDYTIATITVNEWLYNPLPAKTIEVMNIIGLEDEAEFTQNESVLLMLKDKRPDKHVFLMFVGSLGKRPISDRDAVIEELKSQGKWQDENQTGNMTNETEAVENMEMEDGQEEDQNVNDTNDTKTTENTGTTTEQDEKSNQTQKSNTTPFMSPVCVFAVMLGAVIYIRRKR